VKYDDPNLKTVSELLKEEGEKLLAELLREAKKVTTAEEFEAARKAKRRSGSQKCDH
jgi:predicted Zn-dependent peptidase